MAQCRCKAQMKVEGTRMVCVNRCGYSYEVPKRLPTYQELLAENTQLKLRIAELEK